MQAPAADPFGNQGVTPVNQRGMGKGPGVRDAGKAQYWLNTIKQATARFASIDAARAAGYVPNPASPDHMLNRAVNRTGNPNKLGLPATLMYDNNGRLIGAMLSANPNQKLPDFGAGAWHRHPADDKVHMHIFFNKSVQGGAFENNTGFI